MVKSAEFFRCAEGERDSTMRGEEAVLLLMKSREWSGFAVCTGYPQKIHIVTSPSTTCTTLPPTRTFAIVSPDFAARI